MLPALLLAPKGQEAYSLPQQAPFQCNLPQKPAIPKQLTLQPLLFALNNRGFLCNFSKLHWKLHCKPCPKPALPVGAWEREGRHPKAYWHPRAFCLPASQRAFALYVHTKLPKLCRLYRVQCPQQGAPKAQAPNRKHCPKQNRKHICTQGANIYAHRAQTIMQVFAPTMSTAKPQTISKPNRKHTCKPKPKPNWQSLASTLPQAQAPRGKAHPTAQAPKPLPCPSLPQAQTAQRHTLPLYPALCRNVQSPCTIARRVQNVLPRNPTAQQRKAKQTKRATCNAQAGNAQQTKRATPPLAEFIIGPLGRRKAASPSQNFFYFISRPHFTEFLYSK